MYSRLWALNRSIFPCHSRKLRSTEKEGWLFEEMCHCCMFAWLLWSGPAIIPFCGNLLYVFDIVFPSNTTVIITRLLITANDYYLHLRQYTFSLVHSHSYRAFTYSLAMSNLLSYCGDIMIDMYSVTIIIITFRYPDDIYDLSSPIWGNSR
jgi:hypothetical protein